MKYLMTIIKCLPLIFFLIIHFESLGQDDLPKSYGPQPEVGKAMPDFTLKDVTYYKKREATLSDFKGGWLFIDFWFTGCRACIASFPRINKLNREFKDKLNYVLVGVNAERFYHSTGIASLYERLRKKMNLNLISAYDSVLNLKWGIYSMPHIIIVDPEGIVRYITDGRNLTDDKIRALLSGQEVSLFPKDIVRPAFDPCNKTGVKEKITYQSLLTKWNGELQAAGSMDGSLKYEIINLKNSGSINFSCIPLIWLYNWAYIGDNAWDFVTDSLYGKVFPKPVLEMSDKNAFEADFNYDVGKGIYNYSLTIPPDRASIENVMKIMQEDLKRAFGYDVRIDKRKMPAWQLVSRSGSAAHKLETKGGIKKFDDMGDKSCATGFRMENFTVKEFLNMITYYVGINQPPFFDRTGILKNIDISIDADMNNMDDVQKGLQKIGLDLIMGEEEMTVVVISDDK